MDRPLPTVTGSKDYAVVGVQTSAFTTPRHGERDGQAPRSRSILEPLPTITGTDNGAQLVGVALTKHFTGVVGQAVDQPIGTVTGIDHHSVLAVSLANYHSEKGGETRGQGVDEPIRTLDTQNRFAPVAAHLVKFRGDSLGTPADEPLPTITSGAGATRNAGAAHALGIAAAYLSSAYTSKTCGGQGNPNLPHKTITAGGHHSSVVAIFLSPFYGNSKDGATPAMPCPTVVGKDRFALCSVEATPRWFFTLPAMALAKKVARWAMKHLGKRVEKHLLWVADGAKTFPLLVKRVAGELHIVTDIAMRMLRPRELARAQGFDESYVIDRTVDGTDVSRADQVKLIGNSVPPDFAHAIVKANVVDMGVLDDVGEAVSA